MGTAYALPSGMTHLELESGSSSCVRCDTCPLDHLRVGSRGRVVSISGEVEFRRRLLEMGFCNATCVELVRRAPFGDPIEFHLRGYNLSLRAEQARHVMVVPASS